MAVDDQARLKCARLIFLRLQNNSAEEVGGATRRVFHAELGQPANVVPQGGPLVFETPHVGSLEQRNDQVLREIENIQWGTNFGLHTTPRLPAR